MMLVIQRTEWFPEITFHSGMKAMLSVSKSKEPRHRMVERGPLHTQKNTVILTRMYFAGSDPASWAESVMLGSVGEEMYLWTCYLGLYELFARADYLNIQVCGISRVLCHTVALSLWWHLWKDSQVYGEGLEEMMPNLSYLVWRHWSHSEGAVCLQNGHKCPQWISLTGNWRYPLYS